MKRAPTLTVISTLSTLIIINADYTITNSNISYLGIDKVYIDRTINRALDMDFGAFMAGYIKET